MTHYSDDDLVLLYYGEPDQPADAEAHMAGCADCASRYRTLAAELNGVALPAAPAPGEEYGRELWSRLAAKVPAQRRWPVIDTQVLRWVAAVVLVAGGFAAGRVWPHDDAPARAALVTVPNASDVTAARQRVLFSAVAEHFERSDRWLTDFVDSAPAADAAALRMRAEDLVWASRFYRQGAAAASEPGIASVLEEIERACLDVANAPANVEPTLLEPARQRLDADGLLFKVRTLGVVLRQRGAVPGESAPASTLTRVSATS